MKVLNNIQKQIKKHLYGKPQIAYIYFPAGFEKTASENVNKILENLYLKTSNHVILNSEKSKITLENCHIFNLNEIIMRATCITDVRLRVVYDTCRSKDNFSNICKNINWDLYLNSNCTIKVKVNSVASKVFHEGALKQILEEIINSKKINTTRGENSNETTCLYAELYKDKLTISLSLCGESLYKRGYRGILNASAPIKEDIAQNCLQSFLQFLRTHSSKEIDCILLPFSGTGTFTFESLIYFNHISPALFAREYAFEKLSFYNPENVNFILKKCKESIIKEKNLSIISFDNSEKANISYTENINIFSKKCELDIKKTITLENLNFLKEFDLKNFTNKIQNEVSIFAPLNPPYGIRLNEKGDSVQFYKRIAIALNQISKKLLVAHKEFSGFILCPNKDTWSHFCNTIATPIKNTYHFTQGGLDIRVCQFVFKNS